MSTSATGSPLPMLLNDLKNIKTSCSIPRRSSPSRSRRTSPVKRLNSPLAAQQQQTNLYDDDNDSDEENEPQLSELAKALLKDFPEMEATQTRSGSESVMTGSSLDSAPRKRGSLTQSPLEGDSYSTASTGRSPVSSIVKDLVTPALRRDGRRVLGRTDSISGEQEAEKEGEYNRYVPATGYTGIGRTVPGSITTASRWKRNGRGLLGGLAGPPRRGPRLESDQNEDAEKEETNAGMESKSPSEQMNGTGSAQRSPPHELRRMDSPIEPTPSFASSQRRSQRSSPERPSPLERAMQARNAPAELQQNDESRLALAQSSAPGTDSAFSHRSLSSRSAAIAAAVAAGPAGSQNQEKENMPPPTFRRQRASPQIWTMEGNENPIEVEKVRDPSPSREPSEPSSPVKKAAALVANSGNSPKRGVSPKRPAPPPPKMTMLNTMTAQAGASATKKAVRKKTTAVVVVNGKNFKRLDAIGRGGSSRVYKVLAENYQMFALKKVLFGEQDGEAAVAGYKGEIELLNAFKGCDRIIQLYDWEIHDNHMYMLLECGETDLAKALQARNASDDSILDVSFVRHYWREMLECVKACHDINVIHSDLKPANFLIVKGRLKLIDFGIANAIQDDTVNVHRESQVGTLNYMAPEAITDINASSGRPKASVGHTRLMKLGAPSDVWSLGCILYQMTYGECPFAHCSTMYQKMQAIPDPNYEIIYEETGIGGGFVPRSLIATIKGCLERDKERRATIRQFLSADDPFLNPDSRPKVVGIDVDTLRSLLSQASGSVAANGPPDGEMLERWSADIFRKLAIREAEAPARR